MNEQALQADSLLLQHTPAMEWPASFISLPRHLPTAPQPMNAMEKKRSLNF